MWDRRQFIAAAGAGALVAPLAARAAAAGYPADAYRRSIIIDSNGGPGDFEAGRDDDAPLSAHAVADARASGITAVNVTVNVPGNGPGRFEATVKQIAYWDRQIQLYPETFMPVLRAADLAAAKASGRVGLIYGVQDTSMLEGDLGRLELFEGLGLRIVQPTYNRRNLMGDGCLEPADSGLSTLGRQLIVELNRRRLLLDLSHAGARTIAEGIAASKSPLAISHTGCRALVDVPRNVGDESLKALADKGGVVGIYSMCFLKYLAQPHSEDLIRHIEHAVDVCGEDHVGLGTDGTISALPVTPEYRASFKTEIAARIKAGISAPGESPDVLNMVPEYNSPQRFQLLADDLARRGWPATRIEKLLGGNFARLFTEVWG
jgi:membrane dipeptidase